MRFRVLGSVTAAPQTPTAPKVRSVLAVLLTRTNQPVSALTLTDELWGDTPPRTAVSALQVYISQLRRVLKEDGRRLLSTDLSGYRLHIAPDDLDLTVFEALSHEGCRAVERGEYGFGAEVLRSALDLWCGPALSGVGHGPVLARAAECLEDLRLTALDHRITADLRLGRHAELTGELMALTQQYPRYEPFHAHLMMALFRSCRRADAVKAYVRVCGTLDDEGVQPGVELRTLHRRILTCDPVLAWREPAWL
jgi:DNA-binding SARP family transcriptional activator